MNPSNLLNTGRRLAEKRLKTDGKNFPSHGLFEVAARFEEFQPSSIDKAKFIQTIQEATPYVGDYHSWSFSRRSWWGNTIRPISLSDGFETHCYSEDEQGSIDSIRFNRFLTKGEFYHLRTLADDDRSHGRKKRKPFIGIDVDLPVIDVLASSIIAIRYGQAMNLSQEVGRITLAFKWSGLDGRVANSWITW